MIDLPPPALDPPAIVKHERRGAGRDRRGGRRSAAPWIVGSVIILSDGSECLVVALDRQGLPICATE